MFKKLSRTSMFVMIMSFVPVVTHADIIENTETCNTLTASLNGVYLSDYDISENTGGIASGNLLGANKPEESPPIYNATKCIGLFDGNDNQVSPIGANIGEYGDGLLNGAIFGNGSPYAGDSLSGLEFITPDDLQDVDNDDVDYPNNDIAIVEDRDDPGWIQLGQFDKDLGDLDNAEDDDTLYNWLNYTELAISDVLRLSFECLNEECTGFNWTLFTDIDIVDNVQDILGDSTFDHLAFSVKSGQGGWGVYDFNFKEIFQTEVDNGNLLFDEPSAYTTAFVLTGAIDLGYDFVNKHGRAQGISHLTVFARDPADITTEVPEPSTLAILGLGLLGLAMRKTK